MTKRTHAVLGALAGLLLLLGIDLLLLTSGTIAFDSVVVTVLPVAGLVLGAVWGKLAPLGRAPAA